MNEESESSSLQVNSQNNYKYDKYGFVLVNSIEDLLYDRFNYYTGKELDIKKNKKEKKDNGKIVNSNRNFINNPIKRGKRDKENIDKYMKIVLNINNKEKKVFKINPNDSKSIDTITINDKEADLKNYKANKNINNKYYNKKEKNFYKNNENSDQFLYCEEEDEKNDNMDNIKNMKKMLNYNNNSKRPSNSQYLENISETDDEFNMYNEIKNNEKSNPKNMKKANIKSTKNFYHSLPILYPCIISKNRKSNSNIKEIPKSNREFITKEYESENKNSKNKKIMSWPNSTICYFNRSNKIINVNIQIPMQSIINKNYFCTKEIINPNNNNNKSINGNNDNNKKVSNISSQNEVVIKIMNPEKSPFKYGIINIKASSDKNMNSKDKKYVFQIRGNKDKKNKLKNNLFKNKSSLFKIKCLRNKEIINAINKKKSKSKSKSNIMKEKVCPKYYTLKTKKTNINKLTKKIIKKSESKYPKEYRISIKTMFRNNFLNEQGGKPLLEKREEKKIVRNNSMNRLNKNMVYPNIRRDNIFENSNQSLSYINKQKEIYSCYRNLSKYNPNLFRSKDDRMFPAINSYFH